MSMEQALEALKWALERLNDARQVCYGGVDLEEIEQRQAVLATAIESALFTPSVEKQWRDIASAPKDGTWFIAYQDGEIYPCEWRVEEPDEGPPPEGWYDHFNQSFEEPTHWMPAPDPPESGAHRTQSVEKHGETGWLIERGDSEACEPKYWAAGKREAERPSAWTSNHMQAIRFARREDASRTAKRLFPGIEVRICEHIWSAASWTAHEHP